DEDGSIASDIPSHVVEDLQRVVSSLARVEPRVHRSEATNARLQLSLGSRIAIGRGSYEGADGVPKLGVLLRQLANHLCDDSVSVALGRETDGLDRGHRSSPLAMAFVTAWMKDSTLSRTSAPWLVFANCVGFFVFSRLSVSTA